MTRWAIRETYGDGGVWVHTFANAGDAAWALEDLRGAHRGRKYELYMYEEERPDVP